MNTRNLIAVMIVGLVAYGGLECSASALCAELSSPDGLTCSERSRDGSHPLEALRRTAVDALADLLVRASGRIVCINHEALEDECMPVQGGLCLKRYRRVCY